MTPQRSLKSSQSGLWFRLHRNFVLLGFMALLIPAAILATRLRTDNAIERWLGDNDPAVQQWDEFRGRYGIRSQITAVIDNILPTDERIELTARHLERQASVKRVWTPIRLRAAIGATGMTPLDELLVPGGDSITLWIELSGAAQADSRDTVGVLRAVAESHDIPAEAIHLGGPLVINAALDTWSRKSLEALLPVVGFTCFILLWCLRWSAFQSLLLSFSASITVMITFALMELFGGQLDLLLVALPPLIGVLHLSIGIHLLHHFDLWRERFHSEDGVDTRTAAVSKAIQETFAPSCLATMTTIIGMLSLVVSDLGPVRGFGIWSAVGILVSFLVAYTFLPCFLVDEMFLKPIHLRSQWIGLSLRWTRQVVFAIAVLLLICAVPGWSRLAPDFNAIKFLPENSRTITDYKQIEDRCCGLVPMELDVDLTESASVQEKFGVLARFVQRLEEHPDISTAISAISFSGGRSIPESLSRNWQTADGNHFRISALVRSDSDRELQVIANDIQTLSQTLPVTMTGLISLIDESQRAIYKSLRDSLIAAVGLISVVLMVVLRSIPAGLIALIPNVGPIVVGFGIVGWLGLPLDVGTVLTASIALGVALDDSLHFLHQFRQASGQTNDLKQCARETWEICAWPMVQTSLVASAGLSILSLSPFRPVAYFGELMAVLLVLALLADLVLLPYLLTTSVGRLFTMSTNNLVTTALELAEGESVPITKTTLGSAS